MGGIAVASESTSADGRRRVLVINDDPAILEVFRALLEDEGYAVILDTLRTGNLQAQYARLVEELPDAVVLDFSTSSCSASSPPPVPALEPWNASTAYQRPTTSPDPTM
jgi:response regulator RpfG family c-di-GMP phosphodiesterase